MSERRPESVLRCGECNKPFDKESTLKRHGYYCRSQQANYSPKSPACTSCAESKLRCDKMKPECSRCKTKGVECRYVAKSAKTPRKGTRSRNHASDEQINEANASLLTPSSFQAHSETNDANGEGAPIVTPSQFANMQEPVNWDTGDIDFSKLLDPATNSIEESSLDWQLLTDNGSIFDTHHINLNWAIPPQPAPTRLINPRQSSRSDIQRTTTLIHHTLKSYLLNMLHQHTLPPFIHQNMTSTTLETEALDNCVTLVHMLSSGTRGSRKLFWKNVQMECERLCSEAWKLSTWGLLAAMQAVSIYILFRVDEGETEHNDCDSLLLATVAVIAQQLTAKDIASNYSLEETWKDWLYEESRRRLTVIYRVVNMLVYFDPATMCGLPSDLILAPLPAKKELWEASDEHSWDLESKKDATGRISYGLAKSGGLVRLGNDRENEILVHSSITSASPVRTSASWEEWFSGMDAFGSLIMLAALLVVE